MTGIWAYIICELIDGHPSFRHAFVKADDEVSAYAKAHRLVPQDIGIGINDYVFEIPYFSGEKE